MKRLLNKKYQEEKEPEFYLLNENAEVFAGLKGGYPFFSPNLEDAKSLVNDNQVKMIKKGTYFTHLEKYYV